MIWWDVVWPNLYVVLLNITLVNGLENKTREQWNRQVSGLNITLIISTFVCGVIMDGIWLKEQLLYCHFADFKKSFETIIRENLLETTIAKLVPACIKAIILYYTSK